MNADVLIFPEDQRFAGRQIITRYDAAVLFARALQRVKVPTGTMVYPRYIWTYAKDHPAASSINYLYGLGILEKGNGLFDGDKLLTTYDLSMMIYRASKKL